MDRCSFALTCKHICRVTVQNYHCFKNDDTSFASRHRFMTLLSRDWVPPFIHFCFRCNRLRKVNESFRAKWYEPSEPAILSVESGSERSRVDLRPGEWSVWKLTVKNEQSVVAWCPECVQNHTLSLEESERKRLASGQRFVQPCYGGTGSNDWTLNGRLRGLSHNIGTGLPSS